MIHKSCAVKDRLILLGASLRKLRAVTEVEQQSGLFCSVDFAHSVGAAWVLRGLRDDDDFKYEETMRHVNAGICDEITTVFLIAPRDLADVSSSFIKGLVGPAGWERVVEKYLPPEVISVLRGRIPGNS